MPVCRHLVESPLRITICLLLALKPINDPEDEANQDVCEDARNNTTYQKRSNIAIRIYANDNEHCNCNYNWNNYSNSFISGVLVEAHFDSPCNQSDVLLCFTRLCIRLAQLFLGFF